MNYPLFNFSNRRLSREREITETKQHRALLLVQPPMLLEALQAQHHRSSQTRQEVQSICIVSDCFHCLSFVFGLFEFIVSSFAASLVQLQHHDSWQALLVTEATNRYHKGQYREPDRRY